MRDQSARCTRCRGDGINLTSKEIPNGSQVRICPALWPIEGHALSVGVGLGEVGVEEGLTPECLTETTTIAIHFTGREGGGRERERKVGREMTKKS